MKNLKNYTSSIDHHVSMGKIEKLLVEAGATDISKSYDSNQVCSDIKFRMLIDNNPVFFKLPANVDACLRIINSQRARKTADGYSKDREQAQKTAWKIVHDWVEIQLSMIRLEQAKPLQVFLPYVYDPESGTTLYDRIQSNHKLLNPGNG